MLNFDYLRTPPAIVQPIEVASQEITSDPTPNPAYLTQGEKKLLGKHLEVIVDAGAEARQEWDDQQKKQRDGFKRNRLKCQLRKLLITIQPNCFLCGKALQATDPQSAEDYANICFNEKKLACHQCAHRRWEDRRAVKVEEKAEELFEKIREMY